MAGGWANLCAKSPDEFGTLCFRQTSQAGGKTAGGPNTYFRKASELVNLPRAMELYLS